MNANLVLLPGDGIGPEIVAEAERVLLAVAERGGHTLHLQTHLMGGCAIDATGHPLPDDTLGACRDADAILLGAVGGPKWDDPTAAVRPEQGLLKIRKELQLFANLRPIQTWDCLVASSPLREEIVSGTDILFVRELTGGIYFGAAGLEELSGTGGQRAWNVMEYTTSEIERVVRVAARAAVQRRGKLTSVDKANVLEVSRLWRRTAQRVVQEEFPSLTFENVLVDAMAMHMITRPRDFDVVVTGNLFGDILTDEGSVLPGSLGLLPSASLGDGGPGLYEPIHGSAPDIAGQGVANPLATILASAMLLRHSLQWNDEAELIEAAVRGVLDGGWRTKDIARGGPSIGTREMGQKVLEALPR